MREREIDRIRREEERKSEEIRKKDQKARNKIIPSDSDLKVKSHKQELYSAIPVKVTTMTSNAESSIDGKEQIPLATATIIPLPYDPIADSNKVRSESPPPLPTSRPPLERTVSNVSSVHASVQASLSSSSDEEDEEDTRISHRVSIPIHHSLKEFFTFLSLSLLSLE